MYCQLESSTYTLTFLTCLIHNFLRNKFVLRRGWKWKRTNLHEFHFACSFSPFRQAHMHFVHYSGSSCSKHSRHSICTLFLIRMQFISLEIGRQNIKFYVQAHFEMLFLQMENAYAKKEVHILNRNSVALQINIVIELKSFRGWMLIFGPIILSHAQSECLVIMKSDGKPLTRRMSSKLIRFVWFSFLKPF